MRNQVIHIFLCRGLRTSRLSWRAWGATIRTFSRSPGEHLCIGDGNVVVDPLYGGHRLWDFDGFVRKYPIASRFFVPAPLKIDLTAFEGYQRRIPPWKPLAYWLTGWPAFATDDCVGTTLLCLRAAGLNPPPCRSPGAARRWLLREGYTEHGRTLQPQ